MVHATYCCLILDGGHLLPPQTQPWFHLSDLQRQDLPAGAWRSHGVTSIGSGRQLGDRGHQTKGAVNVHTPLRFWKWYVDDTCTVLPGDLVDSFHSHLNSIDNNIQFTWRWSQIGNSPSWTSSWQGRRAAPSAPLCTARPPTRINIWVLNHTIQRCTRELSLKHCCTGPKPSLCQEWAMWRSTIPRPSRIKGILLASLGTPFQPSPTKYGTVIGGEPPQL